MEKIETYDVVLDVRYVELIVNGEIIEDRIDLQKIEITKESFSKSIDTQEFELDNPEMGDGILHHMEADCVYCVALPGELKADEFELVKPGLRLIHKPTNREWFEEDVLTTEDYFCISGDYTPTEADRGLVGRIENADHG